MCLSIAIMRPSHVLGQGTHMGHEWMVIHNDMGYRCGYVKVTRGHPWYGKAYDDVDAEVHGGLTFAEHDEPCDKGGPDNGYWVGFDCGHGWDLADPALVSERYRQYAVQSCEDGLTRGYSGWGWPLDGPEGSQVRTQEYVEAECRSLCEQAATANLVAEMSTDVCDRKQLTGESEHEQT